MSKQPIRVLHVVPNMQQGGLENYIMNMYRNIDREKVQFDFLEHYSEDYFFDDEIRSLGGHIYRIPYMENKKALPRYVSSLNDFFSKHRYSIVHGHMATTAYFYLKAAEKNGVKTRLVHAHEDSFLKNARGIVRMMLIKQAWRHATQLLACSDTAGHYYYGNRPFLTIKNAIDSQKFAFNEQIRKQKRKELGIDDSTLIIGHIGRFSNQKNHSFLIDIFAQILKQCPTAMLVMVGTGETESNIKSKVKELGISDQVCFIPPTANPEYAYNIMDVFVLPSFFEGLPLTGIEAQCNGLPCVFSDTVTREVEITGRCHFVNLAKPVEEWASLILQQATEGRDMDRCEGRAAVVDQGYDAKRNAEKMQAFYLNIGAAKE